MGYETYHQLYIDTNNEAIWKAIDEDPTYADVKYAVGSDGTSGDSCKWYDHEVDMRRLSAQFPDVLFTLNGSDENNEDIWIEYYKGGKMQRCPAIITFDEYDESKLS